VLGGRRLCISIGGLSTTVESDEPDLEIQPQGVISRFVGHGVVPNLVVRTRWTTGAARHEGAPIFDSAAVWRLHRAGDDLLFSFTSSAFGAVPYKTARVDTSITSSEVALHRPYFLGRQAIYPLGYPLDELLFIHLLAQGHGVELHGCGVADRSGDGYLFVGQSGAGKSTTARLWNSEAGVTILSDDRIVVRDIDGEMMIYGTPWHGGELFASSGPARLAGICFLRHGPSHRLKSTTAVEAAARMFACSFVPVYDAHAIEFTLAFLETITRRVPCHELEFAPEASVVDFIRQTTR
jgi:hypothetical protein